MKLYRVTYRNDGNDQIAEFASSKAQAKHIIAEAKRNNENWCEVQDEINYEVLELNTDVKSIIAFLNMYARNAGQ